MFKDGRGYELKIGDEVLLHGKVIKASLGGDPQVTIELYGTYHTRKRCRKTKNEREGLLRVTVEASAMIKVIAEELKPKRKKKRAG